MKLKNAALQELYETIVNGTFSFSPYAECPIDKAFRKCDEELSGSAMFEHIKRLQSDNDILKRANEVLLSANMDLTSKNHKLEQLEKDLDGAKSSVEYFKASRDDWRSRARHEEEEKIEQVKRADNLAEQVNKALGEKSKLQQEVDQLKKDKRWLEQSRLEWAKRAVERGRKLNEAEKEIGQLKNRLDKVSADRTELQKDRDIWFRKNGEKLAEIAELKKQLDGLRDIGYEQGQTDLWDKLQKVNDSQPNEFDVECESMYDVITMDLENFLDTYKEWQEREETDRMREWLVDFCWGRVCEGCPLESKEYKCGCGYSFKMTDPSDTRIIPDKDIKRYYEKARGCGRYTLNDGKLFATPNMEGVNKAITEACKNFCKAVRNADIKITENLRNGYTLKATADVDKDLLMKVCGVKPDEEEPKSNELIVTTRGIITANYSEVTMNAIKEAVNKFEKSLPALDSWESTITGSIKVDDILGKTDGTEHEFEYGDAVRLPWRDYDYMYIDADKNHINLFNPKTHTVVLVSPSEKLTYQGCKIILTDEEDLKKIWKDKK